MSASIPIIVSVTDCSNTRAPVSNIMPQEVAGLVLRLNGTLRSEELQQKETDDVVAQIGEAVVAQIGEADRYPRNNKNKNNLDYDKILKELIATTVATELNKVFPGGVDVEENLVKYEVLIELEKFENECESLAAAIPKAVARVVSDKLFEDTHTYVSGSADSKEYKKTLDAISDHVLSV